MKVVDDAGRELPWDGTQRRHAQGARPVGLQRLLQAGEPSVAHAEPGWFATGDVANIAPDGTMQITDRAKDVIKSGGEWISSIDLENIAAGHPGRAAGRGRSACRTRSGTSGRS